MPPSELTEWLDRVGGPSYVWYVKRLSGNDTLANESHNAGPYIPKEFLFNVFPALNRPEAKNPDVWFELFLDSHDDHRRIRAIWYNNKFHGNPKGGRDEARLTNFGGARSALLNPSNTGALTIFAFLIDGQRLETECHVWVSRNTAEEDLIEDRVGPVEPGKTTLWSQTQPDLMNLGRAEGRGQSNCWLHLHQIPTGWMERFPTGQDIIRKTVELRVASELRPDLRLMKRRDCEYEIFRSLEEATELRVVQQGFRTLEEFIARAQSILQRRKSRSGRSLELHTREIFVEEGLREGIDFEHQPESDAGKRPDFLFPSSACYKDAAFPQAHLRMLAVKTTCKERWRQILSEATRIPRKHLLTLQEGVSAGQFREMTEAGVQLVVPQPLISAYPHDVRPQLQTLESFIADVRLATM